MKFLVTGCSGQLGYDIVRELNNRGFNDVLATTHQTMDITNEEEVNKVINSYCPDVIFHCAAYTNVNKAEDEKDACYNINVNGTKYITKCAEKINAKLFYISTDYIFGNDEVLEHDINETPKPLNVYGLTKYQGEEVVRAYVNHFIVRISWVFGINGNNFIKTMLKLAETKTELNIVGDQVGSPTYTVDLSKLLVDMASTEKYGTYHITNEGYCSWYELANYVFEICGINIITNEVETKAFPAKANRPLNSKLSKTSLDENGFERLPKWQDAVKRYTKELKRKV